MTRRLLSGSSLVLDLPVPLEDATVSLEDEHSTADGFDFVRIRGAFGDAVQGTEGIHLRIPGSIQLPGAGEQPLYGSALHELSRERAIGAVLDGDQIRFVVHALPGSDHVRSGDGLHVGAGLDRLL